MRRGLVVRWAVTGVVRLTSEMTTGPKAMSNRTHNRRRPRRALCKPKPKQTNSSILDVRALQTDKPPPHSLIHMARQIPLPVIRMDERALHPRHALQHILQRLAQIVDIPEGAGAGLEADVVVGGAAAPDDVLVQDDVDLDVDAVADVVGGDVLDAADGAGEAHGEVEEDVALVRVGGAADEVADVAAGGEAPGEDDVGGEEEAAEGVEPPAAGEVADEGEEDGAAVEEAVGDGVLRERLHGGVADEAAPEPAEALDEHRGGHDGEGGGGEADDGAVGGREPVERLERHLHEGRDHDDREDEDADGLEPVAPDGVLVARGAAGGEPRGGPDDGRAEEVEGAVDEGREDRDGGRQDRDDDFEDQEDGVGGEVEGDGDGDRAGGGVGVFFDLEGGQLVLDLAAVREMRGVVGEKGTRLLYLVDAFGALDSWWTARGIVGLTG